MPRGFLRTAITCMCTAVVCSASVMAAAGGATTRSLYVTVRGVDGAQSVNSTVVIRTDVGAMVKAEAMSDGTYYAAGVGAKTVIEVSHPQYGDARIETLLPLGDPVQMNIIFIGQNRALLLSPPVSGDLSAVQGRTGPATEGQCPGDGSCCEPNGSPGCDDADCCNIVCAADPFCCATEWDSICAGEAEDLCGDLCGGDPPADCGNCDAPTGGPGCSDPTCQAIICGMDPFCCDVEWDQICADEAVLFCDCGGGGGGCDAPLDCPPDSTDEGEACGSDTNGGCNSIPPIFTAGDCTTFCGTAWADGATRDTDWYLISHGGGVLSATLTSEFSGVCFILDGIGSCNAVVVGQIGCSSNCTPTTDASADLPAGQYVVFVATGDCAGGGIFDGIPCGGGNNAYILTITGDCIGPCQGDDDCPAGQQCVDGVCVTPPATNDDCNDATSVDVGPGGSVDIAGSTAQATIDVTPACGTSVTAPGVWYSVIGNGNTMTASTCNQASYDTKITVFCGDCGEGGAGSDCCTPGGNGTPGCDDPECEALICGLDSFCCDTSWDTICAAAAADLCEVCSGGGGDGGLICIDGIDDTGGCGGFTTELSWCANAGSEYLILIHGFGSGVGSFTLTVSDNGAVCTPTVECPVGCETDADCPAGFTCEDGDCIPIPPIPTGGCCQCDGGDQFCTIETEDDCAALGGAYLGDDAACEAGGGQVTVSSNPNLSIPDVDPFGVSDTINVGSSFTIVDLEVQFNITHTWIGDLCVSLSKDGSPFELLMSRIGADTGGNTCHSGSPFGCSDNNLNVVLDDEAASSIEAQCAPNLTGTFRPDPGSLAGFLGGDAAGAWTLNVVDNAAGDLGTFVSWSLTFTQPAGGDSPCAEAFPGQCVSESTGSLDIKPGSCPNSFNRNSNGVLPVALVGTNEINAADVDLSSLALSRADGVGGSVAPHEGPPGPHTTIGDSATAFGGELCDCHELEGDGIDDVNMKFKSQDVVDALQLNDLPAGALVELVLTGTLLDGTEFSASDCIRLVPPGTPPGVLLVGSNVPGVWVDVSPIDDLLDEGGFASFNRAYPQSTVVTVSGPIVPMTDLDWVLSAIWIDGVRFNAGDGTVEVTIEGDMNAVVYQYRQLYTRTPRGGIQPVGGSSAQGMN